MCINAHNLPPYQNSHACSKSYFVNLTENSTKLMQHHLLAVYITLYNYVLLTI